MCPEYYCHESYARSIPNLEIVQTLHVPHVRLAESILFSLLHRFRIDRKHEMFAIEKDDDIVNAFNGLKQTFHFMATIDPFNALSNKKAQCLDDYTGKTQRIVHKLVKDIFQRVIQNHKSTITKEQMRKAQFEEKKKHCLEQITKWSDRFLKKTQQASDKVRNAELFSHFLKNFPDARATIQIFSQSMISIGWLPHILHGKTIYRNCILCDDDNVG